jgi:G3E family GTPase
LHHYLLDQIQAKYTDCLILNKYELVSDRELDDVLDHLYELNDETPVIHVSKDKPLQPDVVFGLDTKLFLKEGEETAEWEASEAGAKKGSHSDEVETKSIWRGGKKPGSGKPNGKQHVHAHVDGDACTNGCEHGVDGEATQDEVMEDEIVPVDRGLLEEQLKKLPFEIYRGACSG